MEAVFSTRLLFQDVPLLQVNETPAEEFSVEGNNARRILFLYRSASRLTEKEGQMLDNMLSALKLTRDDIALLRVASNLPFHFLKDRIVFKKLITFGLSSMELNLNIKAEIYRPLTICDTQIVFSESVQALLENKQAKEKLWIALKEIFLKN